MGGALYALCPRLIPAWAGKTSPSEYSHTVSRAHPRVGGENTRAPLVEVLAVGSSPRGRGKRHPSDRPLG